ncbi:MULTISPECIES: hypothetical protein [Bacillaceae]|uniref:hypothetical protein n=1 Tax=Bacillaceae TaxID=186817 RepID=UPI000C333A24|nr:MULTISPECIES: hypothetical protein [Bacillaceae]MCK1981959.1 hypothetical protein [Peribacillus sp. Aquil_B1]MCK2009997.1 hypothetical protein [Peribacillus sp. Aquil_B8]PKF89083.1 hypothetical protein CW306_07070 [Bacillus sp. BA3]
MNPNAGLTFAVVKANTDIGNGYIVEYATIVVKEKSSHFFKPHPVTDFIRTIYAKRDNNYNTQKAAAESIKRFLNWLLIDNYETYRLSEFKQFRINHVVDYLNYKKTTKYERRKRKESEIENAGRYRSSQTLKKDADYIFSFYIYLAKRKILPSFVANEFLGYQKSDLANISIFSENGFSLPGDDNSKNKPIKITAFPNDKLIMLFLKTALESSNKEIQMIALAVYFEFFGGLRAGEVTNVSRSDLILKGEYGARGCSLSLSRKQHFWLRLRNTEKTYPKGDTSEYPTQEIQLTSLFPLLVKNHFSLLNEVGDKNKFNALFLDQNNNPMSGDVFEKRFMRLKNLFLKRLEDEKNPHYTFLNLHEWDTHIGRGIYTNLMARKAKSPEQLALWRRDKSTGVALRYLSKFKILQEKEEGLEALYTFEFND